MATVRCNCGVLLSLPQGASTARCPKCYATVVCPTNNGYYLPAPNQNNGYYANNYPSTWYGYGYGYYQQPPPPLPQLSPISVHGRKRAVLIGISYHGHHNSVKGSVNDVRLMTHFLVNTLRFPNASVLVLTEEERNPDLIPTIHNIRMALRWLVEGCQSGDSLVFFYSGHDTRVPDFDLDKIDGFDESICPVDYYTQGPILDDEINATIVRPLPYGAKLHAIIDTCRSVTLLDLPFACRMDQQGKYGWHPISRVHKGTSGGAAICFSACDDHETTLYSTPFSALTCSFIEVVQSARSLTDGILLHSIRTKIFEVQMSAHPSYLPPKSQVPQLSSTEMFDITSKPFTI